MRVFTQQSNMLAEITMVNNQPDYFSVHFCHFVLTTITKITFFHKLNIHSSFTAVLLDISLFSYVCLIISTFSIFVIHHTFSEYSFVTPVICHFFLSGNNFLKWDPYYKVSEYKTTTMKYENYITHNFTNEIWYDRRCMTYAFMCHHMTMLTNTCLINNFKKYLIIELFWGSLNKEHYNILNQKCMLKAIFTLPIFPIFM
jgi:hypothetical protein